MPSLTRAQTSSGWGLLRDKGGERGGGRGVMSGSVRSVTHSAVAAILNLSFYFKGTPLHRTFLLRPDLTCGPFLETPEKYIPVLEIFYLKSVVLVLHTK